MEREICLEVRRRLKEGTDIFFELHKSESDQTGRCNVFTGFDLRPYEKGFWRATVCAPWCAHVCMSGARWYTLGMTCDLLVIFWRGKRCVCRGGAGRETVRNPGLGRGYVE